MNKKSVFILAILAACALTFALFIPRKAEPKKELNGAEVMEVLQIWKLTTELGLSKEQLITFVPTFNQLLETNRQYWKERREKTNELEQLNETPNTSKAEYQAALDQYRAFEANLKNKIITLKSELNQNLTVPQQAKFIVFDNNYRREMRRFLRTLKELSAAKTQEQNSLAGKK